MPTKQEFILKLIEQGYKVCTDSRKAGKKTLFFALRGENHDGNKYAIDALKNGCEYAIVDKDINNSNQNIIQVNNVLDFLQSISRIYRSKFPIPVIAITGTNGKTTTKELISRVLQKKFKVLSTTGNLNNHIGAPLTLLELNNTHQIAVIEIGANQPGEIEMLCNIVNPNHGLITNIGKAHLEGFKNLETIIETKSALYNHLITNNGIIFQKGENEILTKISGKYDNIITYGTSGKNFINADIKEVDGFMKINYSANKKFGSCNEAFASSVMSNMTGIYNFENILAAITVGLYFGVPTENINEAISSYKPENSRSQIIDEGKNLIFMDAYNANPTSMLASLNSFLNFGKTPKAVILGDMLELGAYTEIEHEKILEWISKNRFEKVLLVGSAFKIFNKSFRNYHFFDNSIMASDWLKKNPIMGHTILVKGSRGIQLEKILDFIR